MIAAVITAYKPDHQFAKRFKPLLSVCSTIIVSDNTPGGHQFTDLPVGFTVIHNLQNVGLGRALNVGIDEAKRQGAEVAILFDQDSTPTAVYVSLIKTKLDEAISVHGHRCCIGPRHIDDSRKSEVVNSEINIHHLTSVATWREVTCLPTSGMIFSLHGLTADDVFSDILFLDLVDFEWCWRLRQSGWIFLRAIDVKMFHRLGEEERHFLGFTFHVPAPYRHYFQFRDTLRIFFSSYVPLYPKLRLISILPIKLLLYPFMLDRGFERLSWMVKGVFGFVRKEQGIGAAADRLSH